MAATCWHLARSALLKGVRPVPCKLQWAQAPLTRNLQAYQCQPLHLTSGPALSNTKTGPQQNTSDTPKDNNTGDEDVYDGPEYIPRRKAKNPMMKIGYLWMIGLPCGILAFVLAKREVDKNRLKQLKVRQRMKRSNEGDYEGSRYRNRGEERLELDR